MKHLIVAAALIILPACAYIDANRIPPPPQYQQPYYIQPTPNPYQRTTCHSRTDYMGGVVTECQ